MPAPAVVAAGVPGMPVLGTLLAALVLTLASQRLLSVQYPRSQSRD